jgi:hypothetical protein
VEAVTAMPEPISTAFGLGQKKNAKSMPVPALADCEADNADPINSLVTCPGSLSAVSANIRKIIRSRTDRPPFRLSHNRE